MLNGHLKLTMSKNLFLSFSSSQLMATLFFYLIRSTGQNLGIILALSLTTIIQSINLSSKHIQNPTYHNLSSCYSSLPAFILPRLLQKLLRGLPAPTLARVIKLKLKSDDSLLTPLHELLDALHSAPPVILPHSVFSSHTGRLASSETDQPIPLSGLCWLYSCLGILSRY